MIQTTKQVNYGSRVEKRGKIRIEIRLVGSQYGLNKFIVTDWDITANPHEIIQSFEKTYSDSQIDNFETIIEANNVFTGLTRSQKKKKILAIQLMTETQSQLLNNGKTIFQLDPIEWEYTP